MTLKLNQNATQKAELALQICLCFTSMSGFRFPDAPRDLCAALSTAQLASAGAGLFYSMA